MNSLTTEQKIEVEDAIISVLRKTQEEIVHEVIEKCPYANRNHITGILGNMQKVKKDGKCYYLVSDDNTENK